MTNPFKAGDRVRCIRGFKGLSHAGAVVAGRDYIVERVSYFNVSLADTSGVWDHNRFEPVSEPLKIGDRVRVVKAYQGKMPDLVGTVRYIGEVTGKVGVEFPEDIGGHSLNGRGTYDRGWYFPADHLERVKDVPTVSEAPASKTFIISLRKPDGSFAPAEKPRIYQSRKQAEAVASTMADKHSGDFIVFEAVALASRPAAVVPPVTLTAL